MPRIRIRARQLEDRHFFIGLSDRIALITQSLLRPGKNGRKARVKAGYFGFSTRDSAQTFVNNIRGRFPKARIEVRQSKRLNTPIEVKISGDFVEALCWELLKSSETVSQKVERHLQVVRAIMPSTAPDMPVHRDRSTAPAKPRHADRTVVTTGRFTVGID